MTPGSASQTSRLPGEKLGWQPKVPLEEGIRRRIEYFRQLLEVM